VIAAAEYGTFTTLADRSRPNWRAPISTTGVPKLAASIMPLEAVCPQGPLHRA
jgi:hypothetical protein